MSTMLSLWGCGGGGTSSYNQPITTTSSPAIIDATTLKRWIDEGKLNAPLGSKDRVVVVSPSTVANWKSKGHIPGAVRWDTTELAMTRVEGLATATSMMPTGAMMDGIIQRLGIDGNTTIVVSLPKNDDKLFYSQSLIFWNLRYWGFARNRIKILNAGDDAWEVAGFALSTDATDKYTPSTYSVAQNGTLKDVVRYSIGEMIGTIDALIAKPALKDEWQMVDVRDFTGSYATTPYISNALRMNGATRFFSRLDAGDGVQRNFMYPDKATLESRFATMAVKDGDNDVHLSATKKTVVMCYASTSASPSFVLFDAVLNMAEGNIMMFDGSASQWNIYSTKRLTDKYQNATAAQISAWAFDNATSPTRAVGTLPVPDPPSNLSEWYEAAPVYAPSATQMNQIETTDKAYMSVPTSAPGSTTGSALSAC